MLVLLWFSTALGATWTVGGSSADYTTIQAAIDGATSGDVIEVAAGTYTEALDLSGMDLEIRSTAGKTSTFLAPPEKKTAVRWTQSESGSLEGFTVQPSKARAFEIKGGGPLIKNCLIEKAGPTGSLWVDGGAAHIDDATPAFHSVEFEESYGRYGGTIYAFNNANVELVSVTIDASTASSGGAIFAQSATIHGTTVDITDASSTYSGGAIYLNQSTLTVDTLNIQDARGEQAWGSGIWAGASSTLTLTNGFINGSYATNYVAGYGGGAIRLDGSGIKLTVDNMQFDGNKGYEGGAISIHAGATAELTNVSFSNNEAHVSGGALYASGASELLCTGCTFNDNTAPKGGGLTLRNQVKFTDIQGTYRKNIATNEGGAFYLFEPDDISFSETLMEDNQAKDGGALHADLPADLTLTQCLLQRNSAASHGGALYISSDNVAGNVRLLYTTMEFNTADSGGAVYASQLPLFEGDWCEGRANTARTNGGAFYHEGHQNLSWKRSILFNNGATGSGGGWYEKGTTGASTLAYNLWIENTADLGAGLFIEESSSTSLQNNTLAGNNAGSEGDHAYFDQSTVSFINNIAAYGRGTGAIYADEASAAVWTVWYNDVWNNIGGNYTGSLTDPTGTDGNLSSDPLFQIYSVDGVESNDNLHLQTSSPCIDAGWPTLKDLDGSNSDMGAFGGPAPRVFDSDEDGWSDLEDCNDGDASIYPGATEIPYDGIDQDCDGLDLKDVDLDGYESEVVGGVDCNDNDNTINPASIEIWYDGVDQNCDARSDFDQDLDGFDSDNHGGVDCNDLDDSIFPGAPEIPNDGIDQDCNEEDAVDADGDGFISKETGGEDCDDTRAEAYPGAPELPNSLDDDCDGFAEDTDRDNDGLLDYIEWEWGTDPENPDSDGDTLLDGEEGVPGEVPWDTDQDGRINPLDPDDDADGILTREEVAIDPADMDGDGIPSWLDTDTDGDGLSDAEEGTRDLDNDGLPDFADYDGNYTGGGCVGGKSALALFLLPLFWRRKHAAAYILCLASAVYAPQVAQANGPDAHTLEWYSIGGSETGTVQVAHPQIMEPGWSLGSTLETAHRPLMETQPAGFVPVIQQLTTMSVGFAASPIKSLQWDLLAPVHLDVRGKQGRSAGLGDIRLGTKFQILETRGLRPGVSFLLNAWLPTGKASLHRGNGASAGGAMLVLGQRAGPLRWSLNLGARLGKQERVRNLNTYSGPLAGLALVWQPTTQWAFFGECTSHGASGWDQIPLEFSLGATRKVPSGFWIRLSAGSGVLRAAGSPSWRLILSGGYRKSFKRAVSPPESPSDPPPEQTTEEAKVVEDQPTPPPIAELMEDRIVIHGHIQFEEGSSLLRGKESETLLQAVLDILRAHPEIQHLLIEGHTNSRGSKELNRKLSDNRAASVVQWFVEQGINPNRLLHKGYGAEQPKVDPEHPKANEMNRRVEFRVLR
jgi:predicted outer membrane repeat protein